MGSSYDYVVIGGGTAGLVVAARLTEDPNIHVAVLEAGANRLEDPRVNIPAMAMPSLGSDLDWKFKSVPQPYLQGRAISQPTGFMLGGSSGLNNQALISPSAAGIDSWAKLGNPTWDWKTLAPYYQKFFTLHVPDSSTAEHLGLGYLDGKIDGKTGPVQASFTGSKLNPVAKTWIESFESFDYKVNTDPFSGHSLGGYSNPSTVDPQTKTRSYAASAYFAPISSRPNLNVFVNAEVQKIRFRSNAENEQVAEEVEYLLEGTLCVTKAKKEVILAAGTFQTPKLLELSGIGNPSLLEKLEIPVIIANENVGENLQDHLMVGMSFEVQPDVMTGDGLMRQEPAHLEAAMTMYASGNGGPLAVGGIGSHAIMPLLDCDKQTGTSADLEALLKEQPQLTDRKQDDAVRSILRAPGEGVGAIFLYLGQWKIAAGPLKPENYLSLGTIQCNPFSRGSVHAVSSSASAAPEIDPRYLSEPIDLEIQARHMLFLQELAFKSPMAKHLKPDGERNSTQARFNDIDDAKEYIRNTAVSTCHPCGSCAMRPRADGGVVSEKLLVHGTRNLRVADASIFPISPRGNIQSSVYAVAERAADIIKGLA